MNDGQALADKEKGRLQSLGAHFVDPLPGKVPHLPWIGNLEQFSQSFRPMLFV